MHKLIKAGCLSAMLFSSLATASMQKSGTIIMSGTVVEPACRITEESAVMHFNCQHGGKPMQQTISVDNINKIHNINNDNRTAIRVDYLNDSHTLVLVNVMYN